MKFLTVTLPHSTVSSNFKLQQQRNPPKKEVSLFNLETTTRSYTVTHTKFSRVHHFYSKINKRFSSSECSYGTSTIILLALPITPSKSKPLDSQYSLEKVCYPLSSLSPPPKPHDNVSICGIFDLEDKVKFQERSSDNFGQEEVQLDTAPAIMTMLK